MVILSFQQVAHMVMIKSTTLHIMHFGSASENRDHSLHLLASKSCHHLSPATVEAIGDWPPVHNSAAYILITIVQLVLCVSDSEYVHTGYCRGR